MAPLQAIAVYGRMIKFSHSVFALPFAFSGALLGPRLIRASPPLRSAGLRWRWWGRAARRWVLIASLTATSTRPILALKTANCRAAWSRRKLWGCSWFCPLWPWAWRLINSILCGFYLSPLVLAVLLFYSLTKRFTWASHLVLGLSLGGAPLGAWIAITGGFDLIPLLLCLGVLVWGGWL